VGRGLDGRDRLNSSGGAFQRSDGEAAVALRDSKAQLQPSRRGHGERSRAGEIRWYEMRHSRRRVRREPSTGRSRIKVTPADSAICFMFLCGSQLGPPKREATENHLGRGDVGADRGRRREIWRREIRGAQVRKEENGVSGGETPSLQPRYLQAAPTKPYWLLTSTALCFLPGCDAGQCQGRD
jgi:hypothetical protein